VPVTASGFAVPLTWKAGELAQSPDPYARIVFRLQNADLFTFSVD
jgi:hypothetical protein